MKKLALTICLLVLVATTFAQTTPTAQLALGTYVGVAKVGGGNQSIRVVVDKSGTTIYYAGVKKCTATLEATEQGNVYRETDHQEDGEVAEDSCQDKGFVFFVLGSGTATYHWGATAEAAMAKPSPVLLRKTK